MGEEDKLEPTEAKEVEVDNISSKLARKRKKQLYNSIKHLMEFWFSDVNLGKDRFLSQLIYVDPWIDIEIFLKFNKLRTLTTDLNDVIKALRKSEMIQVSEDGRKVCRITPFGQKQDVDACTIYVEQILPDAEHDWLKSVFSEYGPIDYISLPRFKATQKPKGFAFIEFKNPDSANRAIEAFRAKGCCLSPQMDPDKLVSIATFEKDEKHPDFKNSGSFKLEQEETEGDIANEELAQKKSKKDKNVKLESENERKEEEMKDNKSESDIKDDEIVKNTKKGQRSCSSKSDHNLEEEMIEDVKLDDDIKEKKSYKRKRKSSSVNDSVIEEEEEEVELNKPFKRPKSTSSFEIDNNEPIKTKKGKRISNTSLEMEEGDPTSIEVDAGEGAVKPEKEKRRSDMSEEMEEVEQQDKEEDEIDLENVQDIDGEGDENEDGEKKSKRKRKKKHKRNLNAISFGLQIMPKVEWKRLRNKYLNLQKLKMQHLKQHLRQYQWGEQHTSNWYSHNYYEYENKKVETDQNNKEQKKGLQYTPGVIIKVILDEPVVDVKGIKSKARIHPEVRYVDATEGDKELYLRVGGPELADQVITTKHWSSMELLKGKEEKQYWEKILKDREEKFSKKIRVNQRGRDKLLKKAEKIQGKHVGFDER